MKLWIRTRVIGKGTEDDPFRPDLGGLALRYSCVKVGDEAVCRVAGMPDDIKTLAGTTGITVLRDKEALELIRKVNPNADLESVNVYDPELDEVAKANGIDPIKARKEIQKPTAGRSLLSSQERNLISKVSDARGVSCSDLEEDIDKGLKHAYNRALARLRGSVGLRDVYR